MSFSKRIEQLCDAVSKEADGEKLLGLVDQLNKELEHASQSPVADASAQSSHSPDNSVPRPSTDKTNEENSEAA